MSDRPLLVDVFIYHRCPAVVLEVHHPVKGTEELQVDQELVDEDHHLDLSSWLHSEAWSTLAVVEDRKKILNKITFIIHLSINH